MEARNFTKKPVTIQAVQFDPDNPDPVKEFVGDVRYQGMIVPGFAYPMDNPPVGYIKPDKYPVAQVWDKLHDTWVGVKPGQWIIRGVQGEFYPCDPEVFVATYDEGDGS